MRHSGVLETKEQTLIRDLYPSLRRFAARESVDCSCSTSISPVTNPCQTVTSSMPCSSVITSPSASNSSSTWSSKAGEV